jgi:uncharacterized membrane protein YkgB
MKFTAYEAMGIQPLVAHSPIVGWMYDSGWEPTLGFPALSALPGQFLLKDIVLFGAAVWSLGGSLKAILA